MSGDDQVESCGRCAMTAVTDATDVDFDPYEGDRIEVDESEARAVSRHVLFFGGLKARLNEWANRVIYSR